MLARIVSDNTRESRAERKEGDSRIESPLRPEILWSTSVVDFALSRLLTGLSPTVKSVIPDRRVIGAAGIRIRIRVIWTRIWTKPRTSVGALSLRVIRLSDWAESQLAACGCYGHWIFQFEGQHIFRRNDRWFTARQ